MTEFREDQALANVAPTVRLQGAKDLHTISLPTVLMRWWWWLVVAVVVPCRGAAGPLQGNRCESDRSTCFCDGVDKARCKKIKPVYESAGTRCKTFQGSYDVCVGGDRGAYCDWLRVGQIYECRMRICWLKWMNMMAACPELWPNVTQVTPTAVASASGTTCSENGAPHIVSFHDDATCPQWLARAMLCDSNLRTFSSDCTAKPKMRQDFEGFFALCQAQASNDTFAALEWAIFAACVLACAVAALCYAVNKTARNKEKRLLEEKNKQQKGDKSVDLAHVWEQPKELRQEAVRMSKVEGGESEFGSTTFSPLAKSDEQETE